MLVNFKWPKPDDDSDRKLIRDVIEHKCHLVAIPHDEHGPGFVFSIGLYLHFLHPEFVLVGLGHEMAGTAINGLAALVEQGRRFGSQDLLDEVFANVPVKLTEVHPRYYGDFFGTALWFYRSVGPQFPVLQIVR